MVFCLCLCSLAFQSVNMALAVGDSFSSFQELQDKIAQLENDETLSLWKRDSRTIEKARAKGLKRYIKPELLFYSLQYACCHGGRKFKSRSTGTRTHQRLVYECETFCLTLSCGCELVRLSTVTQYLLRNVIMCYDIVVLRIPRPHWLPYRQDGTVASPATVPSKT